MSDNEFNARVEGNRIVANVIRGYQRQRLSELAQLDTARAALSEAEQARDAEREARRNVEQELAQLREVYDDLMHLVREREAGR